MMTTTPASLAELRAALPYAPAAFVIEALEQGASIDEAQLAYIGWLDAEIKRLRAEAAAANAEAVAASQSWLFEPSTSSIDTKSNGQKKH